jgi:hypothetical protein
MDFYLFYSRTEREREREREKEGRKFLQAAE